MHVGDTSSEAILCPLLPALILRQDPLQGAAQKGTQFLASPGTQILELYISERLTPPGLPPQFQLNDRVETGKATVGRFDGKTPSLTAATTGAGKSWLNRSLIRRATKDLGYKFIILDLKDPADYAPFPCTF